jgi:hypothetical protein
MKHYGKLEPSHFHSRSPEVIFPNVSITFHLISPFYSFVFHDDDDGDDYDCSSTGRVEAKHGDRPDHHSILDLRG